MLKSINNNFVYFLIVANENEILVNVIKENLSCEYIEKLNIEIIQKNTDINEKYIEKYSHLITPIKRFALNDDLINSYKFMGGEENINISVDEEIINNFDQYVIIFKKIKSINYPINQCCNFNVNFSITNNENEYYSNFTNVDEEISLFPIETDLNSISYFLYHNSNYTLINQFSDVLTLN